MQKQNFAFSKSLFCVASLTLFSGMLSPLAAQQLWHRTYKASAYVTLFAIPVFSRAAVGYGSAVERLQAGLDGDTIELDFYSGSIPERAHGLNRFGYVHELVKESADTPVIADYFGLMTVGGSQSISRSGAVFDAHRAGEIPYLAASERIANHESHAVLHQVQLPAPCETDVAEIMRLARASWSTPVSANNQEERSLKVQNARTFLYSIRTAVRSPSRTLRQEFVYVGKRYILSAEKHSDLKVGEELRKLSLVGDERILTRLNGNIKNVETDERTEFVLWYAEGSKSSLPLRFEFRPKPYLKLIFDAQAEINSYTSVAKQAALSIK